MTDWTSGYVADIGYTYGYYGDLNPMTARLALLGSGVRPPDFASACELGFGQGMSVNLHAAASAVQWWGTDFNPAQAGFAQELAQAAGAGARLFDESFADFCRRPDVPEMDFIGLHGIWSWISDENRAAIVDFARRKLKVGGVFYISYNTQPGWAPAVPLRDLLAEHSEVMGSPGHGLVARIDAALAFADKLMQTNPRYAAANPQIADRLKKIASQNRNYLAHEYFNRDWEPMSFAKMGRWLADAKLGFACSANFSDHVDALNLTPEQQGLLKDITDPMFRQTVRDFCTNQQFRKDYWVKGVRPMNALEQREALDRQAVMLTGPASDVQLKATGALGDAKLADTIYAPIIEALRDHKATTLRDLAQAVAAKGVNLAQTLQAVVVLASKGALHPVQDAKAVAAARPNCVRLNTHLLNKARGNVDVNYLASPVTGGGIVVPRAYQLFLLARANGNKTRDELVRTVWRDLSANGQRLVKEGQTLMTPEENIAELTKRAADFTDKVLPLLTALQVI